MARVCIVDVPWGNILILPAEASQYLSAARLAETVNYDRDKIRLVFGPVEVRFQDESVVKHELFDFADLLPIPAAPEAPPVPTVPVTETDIPF